MKNECSFVKESRSLVGKDEKASDRNILTKIVKKVDLMNFELHKETDLQRNYLNNGPFAQ